MLQHHFGWKILGAGSTPVTNERCPLRAPASPLYMSPSWQHASWACGLWEAMSNPCACACNNHACCYECSTNCSAM